jgi:hypothetical protein
VLSVKDQSGCLSAGMQDVDRQTSRALLDFSYHLAIGDMNEAYKVLNPIPHYIAVMCSLILPEGACSNMLTHGHAMQACRHATRC